MQYYCSRVFRPIFFKEIPETVSPAPLTMKKYTPSKCYLLKNGGHVKKFFAVDKV